MEMEQHHRRKENSQRSYFCIKNNGPRSTTIMTQPSKNSNGGGYKFFVRLGDNESSPTCTIRRNGDELSNDDDDRFDSFCDEVLEKYLKHHPDESGGMTYDVQLKYYFYREHTAPNWWNSIDTQQDFDDALDYGGRIHQQNHQRLLQLIAVVKKQDNNSIEKKSTSSPSSSSSSSSSVQQRERNSTSRNKAAEVVASSSVLATKRPPPPAPKPNPEPEPNREPQPNRPPPPPAASATTSSAAASATRQPPPPPPTRVDRGHNASPSQSKDTVAVSDARSQLQRSAVPEPKKNDIAPHHIIAPKKSPLPPPIAPPAAERPKNAASLVAVATAKDRPSLIRKNPPASQEGSTFLGGSTDGNNKKPRTAESERGHLEDQIMRTMTEMNALGITKPPYEKVACLAGGSLYFKNRQDIDAAFSELSKKLYIEVSKDDGVVRVCLTRVGMNRDEYKVNAPQTRDEVHQRIRGVLQVLANDDKSSPSSSPASVPLFDMLRNGESHSRDDITTELGEDGIPSRSLPPALSLLNALGIVDYVDGFESVMMMPKFAFPVFKENADDDGGSGGSGGSSSVAAPAVSDDSTSNEKGAFKENADGDGVSGVSSSVATPAVSDNSTSNEEGGGGVGPVDNGGVLLDPMEIDESNLQLFPSSFVADDETLDYGMSSNFATV